MTWRDFVIFASELGTALARSPETETPETERDMDHEEYMDYARKYYGKAVENINSARKDLTETMQGLVARFGNLEDDYDDIELWELPVSKKNRTFRDGENLLGGLFHYHRNGEGLLIDIIDDFGDAIAVLPIEDVSIEAQVTLFNNLIEEYS